MPKEGEDSVCHSPDPVLPESALRGRCWYRKPCVKCGVNEWLPTPRTPLHAAAFAEDVAGLQLVLRHGAQVNGVDESGRSALMVAADKGQSGTVGRSDGADNRPVWDGNQGKRNSASTLVGDTLKE